MLRELYSRKLQVNLSPDKLDNNKDLNFSLGLCPLSWARAQQSPFSELQVRMRPRGWPSFGECYPSGDSLGGGQDSSSADIASKYVLVSGFCICTNQLFTLLSEPMGKPVFSPIWWVFCLDSVHDILHMLVVTGE